MSSGPESASWGTWADAERWGREAFQRLSPAARLAWLEDVWRLSGVAKAKRESRVSRVAEPGCARGAPEK